MKEEANYLNELNEAQLKPVLHREGPLIVIAGAAIDAADAGAHISGKCRQCLAGQLC